MESKKTLKEKKKQEGSIEIISKESFFTREKRVIIPKTSPNKINSKDLLQGKTLQVYWYILENQLAGVREIQKELNFSSPGLVAYQINKLTKAGIIVKDEKTEKYLINEKIQSGILSFYVKIGTYLIPRISLYLISFLLGFIIYAFFSLIWGDEFVTHPGSLLYLILLIIGSLAFSYESMKMWKLKPN
ncbi:MAG: hypothetical protein ACTSQH_05815 [Candidatus Hodarchaeales archaeon]